MSFFFIAYTLKFDKVTDLAATSNFAILALVTLWFGEDFSYPKIIASLMVVIWSVRLGWYLFSRILEWGEDSRFDDIRGDFWKFFGFWILQIIWIFTLSLPVIYFNSLEINTEFIENNNLAYVGIFLFLIGLGIEALADYTKYSHKKISRKWCEIGLWKTSRHPNYFGNILLWSGIFLFCYSGGVPAWTIIGLIWTSFLLLFVSGIPILERSANKRYGDDETYLKYKEQTSILIPMPSSLYLKIPKSIKKSLLMDFKMYENFNKESNGMED